MQSEKEKSRLVERYGHDEPRPFLAVLKCVVGLAVLCAVSAAPWLLAGSDGGAPQAFPSSMAESKRIFDERRGRREASEAHTKGAALAHDLDKAAPGAEAAGYRGPLIP